MEQLAHLQHLVTAEGIQTQRLSQTNQKLALGGLHAAVTVHQLAGQGVGGVPVGRLEQGCRLRHQPLPRLGPEATQQAGEQDPEGIGLHAAVGSPGEQLFADQLGLLGGKALVTAHGGQGDGGEGLGKRKGGQAGGHGERR